MKHFMWINNFIPLQKTNDDCVMCFITIGCAGYLEFLIQINVAVKKRFCDEDSISFKKQTNFIL